MATVIFRTHESDNVVTKALTLLKGPGDDVVTASGGLARLGRMRKGDTLKILGHGNTTTLGGYSAADLAALLAKNELPSGIFIELVACNCGTGRSPYALELKTQLVGRKILPGGVVAGTGYMWVKQDGTPFSKTKGGQEITAGRQAVATPWGAQMRNVNPSYTTGQR